MTGPARGHRHGPAGRVAGAHQGRLLGVLALVLTVLVVEVAGGVLTGSLALLADAGHMLVDVAGILLALLAVRFAGRPPTADRTFGYYRLEILAAVGNSVLLLGVAALVLVEAARRLLGTGTHPVAGGWMLVVAVAGLGSAGLSTWLLRHGQAESLNLRAAYLEVLGDLLGSAAVVVAAVVVALTGWWVADPLASVLIALLILPRTWHLLREAVDILLEATPRGIDLEEVRRHIVEAPGVADVHDLHVWTITSGMNVISAHVVLEPEAPASRVLDRLCDCLAGHFDVEHSTFQLEMADRQRQEGASHR